MRPGLMRNSCSSDMTQPRTVQDSKEIQEDGREAHGARMRGTDSWLGRMVARKPRMVAAVALANKMARNIWAMMTREQNYRMA